MALDGAFLYLIGKEIEARALQSRIDRIHQPSREEIILVLRWKGGSGKLLISAGADSPRLHFTETSPENPQSPPMFCMLLRKYLSGGKLIAVRQLGMDRVLFLDFETISEMGDPTTMTLAIEIMGRHSNLILINQEGRVMDAIKRVDAEMSGFREVLPGMQYVLPPAQDKLNLLDTDNDIIFERMRQGKNAELSKALMNTLQGVSPLLMREMAHYACRGAEAFRDDLTQEQYARLDFALNRLRQTLAENRPCFTMVLENGRPKEFSFIPIQQYGTYMLTKEYDSASSMLDSFYGERDRLERMKQRSHGILRMLVNAAERTSRKLEAQRAELKQSGERDLYKIYGDLIHSNLYALEKGMTCAHLVNYYDENGAVVDIPLDPLLTPSQNAQKYYAEYKKAVTAERMLTGFIAQGEQELLYIDSVFDAVSRTSGEAELAEIREELAEQGYLRTARKGKQKAPKPQPPLQYRSSDGFTILCGRNNRQNDRLTLKEAKGNDLWCHTQGIPGSHVIVVSQGETLPDRTIEEACIIAAYNSKGRESNGVSVDYTLAKNVRKPGGGKPGMVIFTDYRTAFVRPDAELVQKLAVSEGKTGSG
ncbi:MAG TPA: NFACT family protein [Firmicutes bacterium]|nr:NFACT family protein [Bacillota bacterium]